MQPPAEYSDEHKSKNLRTICAKMFFWVHGQKKAFIFLRFIEIYCMDCGREVYISTSSVVSEVLWNLRFVGSGMA